MYLIAENQYVLKRFQKTIEFKNNGYIVKLPIKKLIKNENLFTDYERVIKQYLNEEIAGYVENHDNKIIP